MAEDLINNAMIVADLEPQPCVTQQLRIHGYHRYAEKFGELEAYGSDASAIQDLHRLHPELHDKIHPELPVTAGQVVWAVRVEMARTVDDVLARRTRSLLLNAAATIDAAPVVARLMAGELGKGEAWEKEQVVAFGEIAKRYLVSEAV
jgi:glycerol-3-phosphate dehydrogenase